MEYQKILTCSCSPQDPSAVSFSPVPFRTFSVGLMEYSSYQRSCVLPRHRPLQRTHRAMSRWDVLRPTVPPRARRMGLPRPEPAVLCRPPVGTGLRGGIGDVSSFLRLGYAGDGVVGQPRVLVETFTWGSDYSFGTCSVLFEAHVGPCHARSRPSGHLYCGIATLVVNRQWK